MTKNNNNYESEEEDLQKTKEKTLSFKLKTNFTQIKIEDLSTPEKIEDHNEEKFIREKSEVTHKLKKLNDIICI